MSLMELLGWAWALAPSLCEGQPRYAVDPDCGTVECLRCGEVFDPDESEEIRNHDCD